MDTTVEVYKVLDHLITGREFEYTEKDLKEAKVSKANLEIALSVLTDVGLVKKTKVGYQFRPHSRNGQAFLQYYNRVLKEIKIKYQLK